MKAVDIAHAEIGTVSSRSDGSVAFRVLSPELLASQAGALMAWHGKACRVMLLPDDSQAPEETITISTEREMKTPGQRLRAVIFLDWKQQGQPGQFDNYYAEKMEVVINHFKAKLPQ